MPGWYDRIQVHYACSFIPRVHWVPVDRREPFGRHHMSSRARCERYRSRNGQITRFADRVRHQLKMLPRHPRCHSFPVFQGAPTARARLHSLLSPQISSRQWIVSLRASRPSLPSHTAAAASVAFVARYASLIALFPHPGAAQERRFQSLPAI